MFGEEIVPLTREFGRRFKRNFKHFSNLQKIMQITIDSWRGCGSYLIDGQSLDYDPSMYKKQLLFYENAKSARKALEIGVHGAHSLFIMLLANPNIEIFCIDICTWTHTEKCIDYLNTHFNNRIRLLKGDSKEILPGLTNIFDFIHIDGDHLYNTFISDLLQCYRLSNNKTRFIFDDYCNDVLKAVNEHLDKFNVINVPDCRWNNCLAVRRV